MEHKSARELRAYADVSANPPPPLDRKGRLERWADLLDSDPDRRISLVHELEFATRTAQKQMRADNSALALAFADPLFRAEGLASDRVGEGKAFFGLNESQTHRLLCSCMHGEAMRAGEAARLVRAIARPMSGMLARIAVTATIVALPAAIYYFG